MRSVVRNIIKNVVKKDTGFPSRIQELLFFTKFNIKMINNVVYFLDQSPLKLYALALTTTTQYDSIALNTDIRIQNACNSAGCFAQFFNGTIPDVSNTAKTVLLTDLSQLYLDNYIFSNVTNNIFLIYSTEQTGNNLELILNRIEARIKKLSKWGFIEIGYFAFAIKSSEDHIIVFPDDKSYFVNYNIRDKTYVQFGTMNGATTSNYLHATLLPNGHIVAFPYNETRIVDIDPIANTATFIDDFSALAAGRFAPDQQLLIESENCIISAPSSGNYFVKYNYLTQTSIHIGSLSAGTGKFAGLVYINDNLIVAIPVNYNKVVNIDPVNETIEEYGSIGTATSKFWGFKKINDNLICCIPRNHTQIMNIDPINKTVDLYGTFSGTGIYYTAILLSNNHLFAMPGSESHILDIEAISKTIVLWGNLGVTATKYWEAQIELENGHIIAFPCNANHLLDIDNTNQTFDQLNDLGTGTNKTVLPDFSRSIISNQIIVYPNRASYIFDYNPISKELFKICYFSGTRQRIGRHPFTFDGSKRILSVFSAENQGILDIELR